MNKYPRSGTGVLILLLLIGCGPAVRSPHPRANENKAQETNQYRKWVPEDYNFTSNQVEELLLAADKKGDVTAAVKLGTYYGYVRFDLEKWIKYVGIAATNGHADSQYNLGVIYSTVPEVQDMNKAKEWFEAAAKSGHSPEKTQPDSKQQ